MSSDIFSLIPNYWNVHERGKDVITLTHGCQAWRKTFILCPSLWTNVNCMDPDKICIYFEHSKGSSIRLQIGHRWDPYPSGPLSQAISQVISHAWLVQVLVDWTYNGKSSGVIHQSSRPGSELYQDLQGVSKCVKLCGCCWKLIVILVAEAVETHGIICKLYRKSQSRLGGWWGDQQWWWDHKHHIYSRHKT